MRKTADPRRRVVWYLAPQVSHATDEILEIVTDECVHEGNRVSSEKMGSSHVWEIIEEWYPNVYCLPGDTEISNAISTVVASTGEQKEERKPKKVSKLPKWVLEKIWEIIKKYPNESGSSIEMRLAPK